MIMGNIYVEALKPALEDLKMVPVYRMASKNGIFDYKKNIIKLLDGSLKCCIIFQDLKKIHEIIAPGE